MIKSKSVVSILIFLMFSCRDSDNKVDTRVFFNEKKSMRTALSLPVDGYKNWVEGNSSLLFKDKCIAGTCYGILYRPFEYEVLRTFDNPDSIIAMGPEIQHYTFRIFRSDYKDDLLKYEVADYSEYDSRVKYFSFAVQDDIFLVDGTDTLRCLMSNFERTYSGSPNITLNLGFPVVNAEKKAWETKKPHDFNNKTIVFDDKVFGNGKIQIQLEAFQLNKIPSLEQ